MAYFRSQHLPRQTRGFHSQYRVYKTRRHARDREYSSVRLLSKTAPTQKLVRQVHKRSSRHIQGSSPLPATNWSIVLYRDVSMGQPRPQVTDRLKITIPQELS